MSREAYLPTDTEPSTTTGKSCWICYDNSNNASCRNDWIEPCRCIGSTRWVHHHCLSQWIDRAERAGITASTQPNSTSIFSLAPSSIQRIPVCPQCRTPYRIESGQNRLLFVLQYAKFLYNRVLVTVSVVGAATCIYLVTFSYGFAVCVSVYGTEEFMNLFHFYLSNDSPLINQTLLDDSLSTVWSGRSLELARCAFIGRCCFGIPLIPIGIISASFRYMSWLYPVVPTIMLLGDRQVQFGWPLPERLMLSLLPLLLKGYRWLRHRLEHFLLDRILNNLTDSELEQVGRNLGISADRFVFIRETRNAFSMSTQLQGSNELFSDSSQEWYPDEDDQVVETVHIPNQPANIQNNSDDIDTEDEVRIILRIRRIADTLFVPFLGSALGRLLFRQNTTVQSKFYRSLLGIGIFILVTDAGYMLTRYWKYKARISREIHNYPKPS